MDFTTLPGRPARVVRRQVPPSSALVRFMIQSGEADTVVPTEGARQGVPFVAPTTRSWVWQTDSSSTSIRTATSSRTRPDIVLVKDKRGRVIGFERLNFLTPKQQADGVSIPVEVQMV